MERTLGVSDLVLLSIGAVIGAGIFASLGTAAAGETLKDGTIVRYGAGPALVISFLLLGVVCGLCGLCYAELSAMIPAIATSFFAGSFLIGISALMPPIAGAPRLWQVCSSSSA